MSFLQSVFEGAKGKIASALIAGTMLSTPSFAEQKKPAGPEIIDRFVILMIDVSQSVEYDEYRTMMKGLDNAFKSEEMKQQLNTGLRFGIGTIFFCAKADFGKMEVMRRPEDAINYANEVFWDMAKDQPYPLNGCPFTGIANALEKAQQLIDREGELGFTSLERSIVVIGDGKENEDYMEPKIKALTQALGEKRNAVVYGIPVVTHGDPLENSSLIGYFQQNLSTPSGLFYNNQGRRTPLKKGNVTESYGFEDIGKAALEVFRLNIY